MTTIPWTPRNLKERGQSLWDSIVGVYELRPDEYAVLADACREADLIERLNDELAVASLTTRGSMGQEVASPFVSEIRQHSTTLSQLLGKLKIPDGTGGVSRKQAQVSEQARAAARARWGSGAGTG